MKKCGTIPRNKFRHYFVFSPSSVQHQYQQFRGVKRGPLRFMGKTKAQFLDMLMRSNARICVLLSLTVVPISIFGTYR